MEPSRIAPAAAQHPRCQASRRTCPAGHIRRREVSRLLKRMDLSPKEEEAVERLGHALVTRIVLGPVFEVMARARLQVFYGGRAADCALTLCETCPETSRIESEQMT